MPSVLEASVRSSPNSFVFVKTLCNMIKDYLKNFSLITSVFLKLQYSKVLDSSYKSWHLIIK